MAQDESKSTSSPDEVDEGLVVLMERYAQLFDNMCRERHELGQQKYGEFTFLGTDTVRMLMEELADAANYSRYMFIKLGILNEYLHQQANEVADDSGQINIGAQAFKGTKEGWGNKQ